MFSPIDCGVSVAAKSPSGKLSRKRTYDNLKSASSVGEKMCVATRLAINTCLIVLMLPFSAGGGKPLTFRNSVPRW